VSGETVSRLRAGERAAKVSVATMTGLALGKYFAAVFSGSIALLADAINSFSDIFSSLAVWAGLRLSQRKPDEKFPYGYYKAETLAMLVVSGFIIASGLEILRESARKISPGLLGTSPTSLALVASAASAAILLLLSRFKARVGSRSGSQSLVGDAKHTMVDVYSSTLVFFGILISRLGVPQAEPVAGIAVAAYVILQGLLTGKDAILVLMDAAVPESRRREIRELVEGIPGVKGVRSLRMRRSGPILFGEMEVEVEGSVSVERTHSLSQMIDAGIKERFPEVEAVTIHFEPTKKEKIRVAVPIEEDRGLESKVFGHFGKAPAFAIVEAGEDGVSFAGVLENPGYSAQKGKGMKGARVLVEKKVDAVVAKALGEGPFHTLRDALIDIYAVEEGSTVRDVARDLLEGKLRRVTSPEEAE